MKEDWFDIKGFEGLYQISNLFDVRSVTRRIKGGKNQEDTGRIIQGKILKPYLYPNGYYGFELYKDGVVYHKLLHRLIAETFIPNPDNLPTVDHINRNTTDNRIENLRWCDMTIQNNNRDIVGMNSKKVIQYDLDGNIVKEWNSMADAKRNGFSSSCICRCCQGKTKTYLNFVWKYA